jgi:hypothetical protein
VEAGTQRPGGSGISQQGQILLLYMEGMRLRNGLQPRTEEEQSRAEDRLLRRQEEKKRKLEELGIDYDFGDAAYVSILNTSSLSKY